MSITNSCIITFEGHTEQGMRARGGEYVRKEPRVITKIDLDLMFNISVAINYSI